MIRATFFLRLAVALGMLAPVLRAEPVDFDLPAAAVSETLLAFSKQAKLEVLFSFDDLSRVTSTAVAGRYEPEDALNHLLRDTGYAARRSRTGDRIRCGRRNCCH
ncbi:MAG: TonB-dependent receptor plug [Bryobacterales bacterium]|nr:TonB-dependent receptor plug [Bryobacterales bacterium]